MTRTANRLSDVAVRQAKPHPTKTLVLPDGYGLRLAISPNGRKHWQYRTATGGKETTVQLGAYPGMGVEAARQKAAELREVARQGLNIAAETKLQRLRIRTKSATTFEGVATELLTNKKKSIGAGYWRKIDAAFRANLFPVIGKLPIQSITPPLLREALAKIEKRGSLDMLANVRRWAAEVFDYAAANGWFIGDNPAHALKRNIFAKHESQRMQAIEWAEVGAFVRRLETLKAEGATIAAVKMLMLTACRPTEVREAKWSEIDLDRARWEIPPERMKMRKMHAVPLSRQTIALLVDLKRLTGHSEYLFPSRVGSKKPCLTDIALLKCVKRAADRDEVHAHGLRALFSTHTAESLKWPSEVKEACLAHTKKGVEGLYDRATFYPERAKLMQWYADEIEAAVKGADVISLPKRDAA